MFNMLVSIIVASHLAQFMAHDGGDNVWLLNKTTVYVGGCVAVVLQAPANRAAQYQLRIGESEPVCLVDSLGLTVRWNDRTVVLLSHDVRHAEHVQSTRQSEELVRIPPIFGKPGVVPLRLVLNDEVVGTMSVEVIETPATAQDSVDLMFPTVDRRASLSERERASAWARLATAGSLGVGGDMSALLEMLRGELPVIMHHPDWAEIAEMLVARLEARAHYSELIDQTEGRSPMLNVSGDVLPPWPAIVTRCLESKPKSLFGHIIQKDIRGLAREIQILDAKRRGDDIWPIYEQAAKEKP